MKWCCGEKEIKRQERGLDGGGVAGDVMASDAKNWNLDVVASASPSHDFVLDDAADNVGREHGSAAVHSHVHAENLGGLPNRKIEMNLLLWLFIKGYLFNSTNLFNYLRSKPSHSVCRRTYYDVI